MQDGVVGRILQLLDASALSSAEWVCKRFRTLGTTLLLTLHQDNVDIAACTVMLSLAPSHFHPLVCSG